MKVNLIFRKPNPLYFSIEKVFESLIPEFPADIKVEKRFVKSERANLKALMQNLQSAEHDADVFHITGDIHYMALAFPRRKTILTIHDCIFMNNTAGIKRTIMKWLWLKLPVMKSRLVTVISESTRKDVIKYTSCAPSKVVVVPDPVAKEFRHIPKPFNNPKPRILQIGTWPNKNLHRVVKALDGIPCELIVIGKLNQADTDLLQRSSLHYSNHFNLTEAELAAQYAASDLLIFASTFEGFGLPIVEAQSTGRVVVTSNLQPMADVAGGAAILVDPYDVTSIRKGIVEAIENESRRQELIANGIENVKQFSAATIAQQYYNLYKQLKASN
jgi:glycosyltransferase involved in cell wall biosynthesis